ncbi:MAG: CvpA family protein [Chloroflexi bacterium]|nr:CvpA family protein [Chloroflexota bacterium]
MDSTVWTVSQQWLVGLAVAFFGYLGFRRGINRELLQTIGTALAIWVASALAPLMQGQVNRLYKLMQLMLSGGLLSDNPAQAWQDVRQLPDLIRTPADVQMLTMVTFIAITLFFYFVGQQQLPNPESLALHILGAFGGVINGFLAAYFLFPLVFTKSEAVIRLPSGEVQQTLTNEQTIARMVAFFVFVLIAFGLYTASLGTRQKR